MKKKELIRKKTKPYSFRLDEESMKAIEKWCGDKVRLSTFVKCAIGDAMDKFGIKRKK